MSEIPEIDVDEMADRMATGAVVVDVREPDEYEAGHVPGALLVPLSDLADRVDDVPSGQPVLLICKSGGRSMRAAEYLTTFGRDVTNVAGGTMAWMHSGRDVVEGTERG